MTQRIAFWSNNAARYKAEPVQRTKKSGISPMGIAIPVGFVLMDSGEYIREHEYDRIRTITDANSYRLAYLRNR